MSQDLTKNEATIRSVQLLRHDLTVTSHKLFCMIADSLDQDDCLNRATKAIEEANMELSRYLQLRRESS